MLVTPHSFHQRQIALIHHYLGRLEDIRQMFEQGREWAQEALRALDQEWQQLQAQQQWAVQMAARSTQMAALVVEFPRRAGVLIMQVVIDEALIWLRDALVWVEAEDFEARYDLLHTNFRVYMRALSPEKVRVILDEMEHLAERLNDDKRRVAVAIMQAESYELFTDRNEEQLARSEQALEMAQRLEDPELLANALIQFGFACTRVYQCDRAHQALVQALPIYQNLGLKRQQASVYNALGANAYYMSEHKQAILYMEEALRLARDIGDRNREINLLANLSVVTSAGDDPYASLVYSRQAWTAARDMGDRSAANSALVAMLVVTSAIGLLDEFQICHEYALESIREGHSEYLESVLFSVLASIHYDQEKWEQACESAQASAAKARAYNHDQFEYEALVVWGLSLLQLGRYEDASERFAQAAEFHHRIDEELQDYSGVLATMSLTAVLLEQPEQGQELLNQLVNLLRVYDLEKFAQPHYMMWAAYQAAHLLQSPHLDFIRQQGYSFVQKYLDSMPGEREREAFLSQYTCRQLAALSASL